MNNLKNKIIIVSNRTDKNIWLSLIPLMKSNKDILVKNSAHSMTNIVNNGAKYIIRKLPSMSMFSDSIEEVEKSLFIRDELKSLLMYLADKNGFTYKNNKRQEVLEKAHKIGLCTPNFIITCDKKELLTFASEYKEIVIKNIGDVRLFKTGLSTYTRQLSFNEIQNDYPDWFAPSYFEQKINKKFEIRTFIIDNVFFSMATISQNQYVDIREDKKMGNFRCCPIILPKGIQRKILILLKELDIKSAAIDILFSLCGNYYIVDVNHGGQFGDLEKYCNYDISNTFSKKLLEY